MVQTQDLRPSFLPRMFGHSFFLAGYRIFVRCRTASGKNLRGLQVLRSETDSRRMVALGNLLTHYRYGLIEPDISVQGSRLRVVLQRAGRTVLDVTAELDLPVLPETTIFGDAKEARRFEGPMPYTFSYEPETGSIVRIEGVRKEWNPKLVQAEVSVPPDFGEFGLEPSSGRLVSAFFLEDVPYLWKRGVVEKLPR